MLNIVVAALMFAVGPAAGLPKTIYVTPFASQEVCRNTINQSLRSFDLDRQGNFNFFLTCLNLKSPGYGR